MAAKKEKVANAVIFRANAAVKNKKGDMVLLPPGKVVLLEVLNQDSVMSLVDKKKGVLIHADKKLGGVIADVDNNLYEIVQGVPNSEAGGEGISLSPDMRNNQGEELEKVGSLDS